MCSELEARSVVERAAEMGKLHNRAPDPETVTIEGSSTSTMIVSKTLEPTTIPRTTTLVDAETITPTVRSWCALRCFKRRVLTVLLRPRSRSAGKRWESSCQCWTA